MKFRNLYFDDLEKNNSADFEGLECYQDITTNEHGRYEKREYRIMSNKDVIVTILGDKWKHVQCIGMARLKRKTENDESCETHYHMLDTSVSAEKYASLARGHWEIKNGLHWILDIHFKEDLSTSNTDHAIKNLSLLRMIAFYFTKLDSAMQNTRIPKIPGWLLLTG
jgi:predicted transposase YbfD/YdcC